MQHSREPPKVLLDMAVGHHIHVKGSHDLPYALLLHDRKRLLQMRERTYAGHCNKRHAREIMHDIGLEGAFDQQYGILGVASDVGPCLRLQPSGISAVDSHRNFRRATLSRRTFMPWMRPK